MPKRKRGIIGDVASRREAIRKRERGVVETEEERIRRLSTMAQRGQDRRAEETEEQINRRLAVMGQRSQQRRAEETEKQRKENTFWGERNVYVSDNIRKKNKSHMKISNKKTRFERIFAFLGESRYGYWDASGTGRQVNYVADHAGLRACVHTNEPAVVHNIPVSAQVDGLLARGVVLVSTYVDPVPGYDYGVNGYGFGYDGYGLGYGIADLGYGYRGALGYTGLHGNYGVVYV
ncbi:hypothetical protein AVEN_246825-1 [Araneus ventricosus]|uniref:STPR domain-containing protein n=1 Tax=Araneus ventricosus TaxID=182803 RepID=A0A4Y2QTE1_ARAVE|nr:hypothetical protein AVEN_246825-1 [Araneus ventricosus]